MTDKLIFLAEKLSKDHSLTLEEYEALIKGQTPEFAAYLAQKADKVRREIYGDEVYVRGLIEISSYCKNNCYYCGLRCENATAQRYRLTPDEIFSCASEGYKLGFRTFVLQGGEDPFFTDQRLCEIIKKIKAAYPDCAITLSLGERSYESYLALYNAGADRYLLRHETADSEHYGALHPPQLSFENRMRCLKDLKKIGYATGCGFMVGSPHQTAKSLAKDLKFIETFRPQMCGIGPFIPHHATPFAKSMQGSVEQTCYLISILRLISPSLLLPATTALGTLDPSGREKGIMAGANVVMPNLSPVSVRKKYELYNGKICTGEESAQCKDCLDRRIKSIGYRVVVSRGDPKKETN